MVSSGKSRLRYCANQPTSNIAITEYEHQRCCKTVIAGCLPIELIGARHLGGRRARLQRLFDHLPLELPAVAPAARLNTFLTNR